LKIIVAILSVTDHLPFPSQSAPSAETVPTPSGTMHQIAFAKGRGKKKKRE